ncbi:hypothetical protein GCM10025870_25360 [Agromyces marinus]|uniref:Superfamily II DNA and RNA helicase n=1 Tax=Agromyces marinus TaxID=1389020 RepID=A0ABN6YJ41_9MICO|nr:hypothetical protein GCM10025870_25360 [Agromyces marinus]
MLGRGKTGSGKTIAFAVPMVARLGTSLAGGKRRAGRPLGLILAPTRELVTQIARTFEPLADAYGLKVTTIFGGINQKRQVDALRAGVDIVVAAPGRLEDLMKQGFVHLDAVEITVLDEADHMADLGFLPVVTRILDKTPRGGQRLLFSATLDNGVDKLVKRYLENEVLHSVDEANSPVAAMTHHVFLTDDADTKFELVRTLASGTGRRILFMRTKHHAKKLAKKLTAAGIPAVDLHGNLSQPQRDRNLAAFGDGSVKVMVATDVAARGVHVDDIELVVHVDPPMEHKAYLHRSGRTARAGSEGDVVTIALPGQMDDLGKLLRRAEIRVTPQQVTPASPSVTALVGQVAAYVKPEAMPVTAQGGGRSQGANAQRKRAAREDRAAAGTQPTGQGAAGAAAAASRMSPPRHRAGTVRAARRRRRRTRRSRVRVSPAARRRRARSARHPLGPRRSSPCASGAWSRRTAAHAPTGARRAEPRAPRRRRPRTLPGCGAVTDFARGRTRG